MLFCQTLFAKTLKFFISTMAFKEICQTLLVRIDFLANSPNFSHAKLSSFMVYTIGSRKGGAMGLQPDFKGAP